jgi:hypothetical protein
MSEISTSAISSFLAVLRSLPSWLLAAVALAAYALLFAPSFGGVDPSEFRTQWGVWIWSTAVAFTILALVRALDEGARAWLAYRGAGDRRALRLVPLHGQSFWHVAKQRDDSYNSQIGLQVEAANLTDGPVRIVKVRLSRPRGYDLIHADASLPMAGSPYHDPRHPIPPHGTSTASIHVMMRGELGTQGESLRISLIVTDQFGDEYRLKRIVVPTHDKRRPPSSWRERIRSLTVPFFRMREARNGNADEPKVVLPVWDHDGKFDNVELILREESRSYTANGRERGGLGSLNVTLQSEPGFGWTEVGKVPPLIWKKGQGKVIGSDNLGRLIALHVEADHERKKELEEFLLSHLHKDSRYSAVAYFVFLALHRFGRAIEALQAARVGLAGDKVFGYSNLLGLLAAVVSHEHPELSTELLAAMLRVLGEDAERNFRLAEKINLARVQRLNPSSEQ